MPEIFSFCLPPCLVLPLLENINGQEHHSQGCGGGLSADDGLLPPGQHVVGLGVFGDAVHGVAAGDGVQIGLHSQLHLFLELGVLQDLRLVGLHGAKLAGGGGGVGGQHAGGAVLHGAQPVHVVRGGGHIGDDPALEAPFVADDLLQQAAVGAGISASFFS